MKRLTYSTGKDSMQRMPRPKGNVAAALRRWLVEAGLQPGSSVSVQRNRKLEGETRNEQKGGSPFLASHESLVTALAGEAVFLGVEQFGEARIFLEEGEVFVVARVVAIFWAQLNGDLEI